MFRHFVELGSTSALYTPALQDVDDFEFGFDPSWTKVFEYLFDHGVTGQESYQTSAYGNSYAPTSITKEGKRHFALIEEVLKEFRETHDAGAPLERTVSDMDLCLRTQQVC